jgi:hypothetical protein
MLGQYLVMMKEDKVNQEEGLYIVNDLFNGKVFLKQSNGYLVGVINTNDEGTARDKINQVIAKLP